MKILVLNSGSSSLKYQLIDMLNESVVAEGLVDRIGIDGGQYIHKISGEKIKVDSYIKNHKNGIETVINFLTSGDNKVLNKVSDISAVGHRVVHGGEKFSESVIVDDEVIGEIDKCSKLAPLHNPANLDGIKVISELLPEVKQVAVFDTAFHQTMKPENYLYAIPLEWYRKHGIRRYGFHGTSHKYVYERTAEILGNQKLRVINCHVGNGGSIAAIDSGKVVETSMGFTPLEGLVMGTRSGNIDPSIINFIQKEEGLSVEEINDILNKKSGVLGLSEISSDLRDIEDGILNSNQNAINAMNVYINRIVKYVGSYTALLGGVDVITFTAGALENSMLMRKMIIDKLGFLGIKLDLEKNDFRGQERLISTDDSTTKVMVIPTNEEIIIARDTYNLIK